MADQARMRHDLHPVQGTDEIAVDLRILTARRYDLTADRTRAIKLVTWADDLPAPSGSGSCWAWNAATA